MISFDWRKAKWRQLYSVVIVIIVLVSGCDVTEMLRGLAL